MSNPNQNLKKPTCSTTGHAWDENIQEYNNPLPGWWLWAFYATFVFAIAYFILYPAWPVGNDYTKGIATLTIEKDGEKVTVGWNTRYLYIQDMQSGPSATRYAEAVDKIAALDYTQMLESPEAMGFVRAAGKQLFATNCASCHGQGGVGVVGQYPALVDDDWLWGGKLSQIEYTLIHGRQGYMPYFDNLALNDKQLDDVATYVLAMSDHSVDAEAATRGKAIFNGYAGGCYQCHTENGTGLYSLGSANLTDNIWTVAKVPLVDGLEAKKAEVKKVIRNGINRLMPAQGNRLSEQEIRILTAYVHQEFGGGQ